MLPSSTSRNREDKLASASSVAIDVLVGVLAQLKEVSDFIPVPYFKVAVVRLYQTVVTYKRTIQNSEDITELVERVRTLQGSVIGRLTGQDIRNNSSLIKRIETFSESLQKISAAIEKVASRNPIIRLITNADDAQNIAGHLHSLNWIFQSFTNSTVIDIELSLHENASLIRGDIKELRHDVRRVEDLILEQQYLKCSILNIPIAPKALYNCDDTRSSCMVDTRKEVLSTIYSWIESHNNNDRAPRIFWLDGLAGTGKSTIAQTVAEHCAKEGWLGASFFFSREDSSRSSLKLVFTTLAEQLALFFKPLKPLMQEVIHENPRIAYTSPLNQFEKLIVDPILALGTPLPSPAIIVIDALDECLDNDAISIMLRTFSYYIHKIPFLVFITSRPEPNIERGFELPELHASTRPFLLHHVEPSLVEHDISLYLRNRLEATVHPSLEASLWFSTDQLDNLVALCEGLFIFASTAVRYIQDPTVGDPKSRLESLLSGSHSVEHASREFSPYLHLDRLYTQALRHAFPKSSAKSRLTGLRMVIGGIVLVRQPQSASDLSVLLGLKSGVAEDILKHVRCLISERGHGAQMHVLHASFADFIQTERCFDKDLRIEPGVYHAYLATQCFYQMRSLKMDICELRNSSVFNSEVVDLRERVQKYISSTLQYACQHWSEHIQYALLSDDLLELLREFTFKQSLFWLEVLSLMGCLESALPALRMAQDSISKSQHHSVTAMIHDLQRFTLEFFGPISATALHIYFSALPFTPTNTLLHKTFSLDLATRSVNVLNGVEKLWDSCLCTMEGHSDRVDSLAFSPDGRFIASGSGDWTVRVWDAATGTSLRTLKGHSYGVRSAAFSPDGRLIASGSEDGTVRLWDAAVGTILRTLNGHSDWVHSVSFSPDGRFIASGSDDRTVRAWDAATGTSLRTLEGHSYGVRSVAFSPDGRFIASGSDDGTLRLWEAATGTYLRTLKTRSGRVGSVAFSPGGRFIAYSGRTEHVWDAATGTSLRTFRGHSLAVMGVAFSPDGKFIVSGSWDTTVQIWDAATGTNLRTLQGHSDVVTSVAYSPDGRFIASGSWDRTVKLWDAATRTNLKTLKGRSASILSVAFSPDGRFIASGSGDWTVRVWDAGTGTSLRTLKGHSEMVHSVAFSPDGRFIASGSADKTVRVWDAAAGTSLRTLKGHSHWVNSVAFSPDGRFIISEFDYTDTIVWDATTMKMIENPGDIPIPQSKPSFIVEPDGWVYRGGERSKRVCWMPVHCRPSAQCSQDDHLIVGTHNGLVIFLDFSACIY